MNTQPGNDSICKRTCCLNLAGTGATEDLFGALSVKTDLSGWDKLREFSGARKMPNGWNGSLPGPLGAVWMTFPLETVLFFTVLSCSNIWCRFNRETMEGQPYVSEVGETKHPRNSKNWRTESCLGPTIRNHEWKEICKFWGFEK